MPFNYIVSTLKNIEALGVTFSEPLIQACRTPSMVQLSAPCQKAITGLRAVKGAHQQFHPMYPNFPMQVMEMNAGEPRERGIQSLRLPPNAVRESAAAKNVADRRSSLSIIAL